MFGSVVALAFKIILYAEMHANKVFLFFKNYFWYQHIKTIQNIQNILNFRKKKIIMLRVDLFDLAALHPH
jgi:GR25 family glycosyltransferase involved in LPS biosynthesis